MLIPLALVPVIGGLLPQIGAPIDSSESAQPSTDPSIGPANGTHENTETESAKAGSGIDSTPAPANGATRASLARTGVSSSTLSLILMAVMLMLVGISLVAVQRRRKS